MYGDQIESHVPDDTALKMPFTVNVAWNSFAPNVAPPSATGTSGGGRQTTILTGPYAVSAPAVVTRYIGTLSVWPAACRTISHVAVGVVDWMHAACDAAGIAPGGAIMISPVSGSNAPPSASATTVALTVPIFVPGAWFSVETVPAGA